MPIRIEHVEKVYGGGTVALSDINLVVEEGTFVSLIGPSGCGKSTLLSLVAGLEEATSGRVTGAEHPGMVFQEAALFPWRTIRDNVAFGLQMQGMRRDERRQRAEEALKQVHLLRFKNAFPHQLSGGMRQRAAIARALVTDPPVLLMDEPFGALDAQTRALLQTELLQVWERTRKTVLFVTHSMDEALTLSDRILLMSARPGRVIGDFRIDAPRGELANGLPARDPGNNLALASLRTRLLEMLSAEVAAVARDEHDADWEAGEGARTRRPTARENVGVDI